MKRTSSKPKIWALNKLGQTAIVEMENAPYPHSSRENGYKNGDKVFPRDPHYIDSSVGLFIPKGYRPGRVTDVLMYFHGHCGNVRQALDTYKIREMIVKSGKNVILVFPEGPKDAADSGCGKLEEPGGAKRLLDEALDFLHREGKTPNKRLGKVILAGHSGGYRVISYILEHGGIEDAVVEACLLDASYDRLDQYVQWVTRKRTARLFSIFTEHLASCNVYMMTRLARNGVPYTLLSDEDVSDEILARKRILFLYTTKLNHCQACCMLEPVLAASQLSDV